MKKLLFVLLFFGGLFGGYSQTYWEVRGNTPPVGSFSPPLPAPVEIEYNLGTVFDCSADQFGEFCEYDFNIIRAGETMAHFQNNLVILGPDTDHEVLIGDPATVSTPAGYKLYVEEGILTERVKVALSGSPDWADYVFKDEYELMPLAEVELFISKYGHLPNIPSAEELVENGGIDLGKMQAAQMAKIEELTLHLIQKDKEVKALQKQVEMLSKQVELLLEKQ